ncbi:hypothetical protein Poli38472_011572 [Pythium oligandrum]|uniref:PDZ domain-containing protein n=1 Tax=Pythium oligandrum TaxID=41045 RepID=A0A8K1CLU7_PYTOL|nr:hypothetical protein Poli38472_011572 [Pythium oligandrum]|eukprot:TMW64692.1 hypothetical protein Poli38472_011572 [Pythium oligandrum]
MSYRNGSPTESVRPTEGVDVVLDERRMYTVDWRDNGTFGFTITPVNSDRGTVLLLARRTTRRSSLDDAGLKDVVPGDMLIAIGDEKVYHLGAENATKYLRSVRKPVRLTMQLSPYGGSSKTLPDLAPNEYNYNWESGPLGIVLTYDLKCKMPTVKRLSDKANDTIRRDVDVGDQLIYANDLPASEYTMEELMPLLREMPKPILMRFRKPLQDDDQIEIPELSEDEYEFLWEYGPLGLVIGKGRTGMPFVRSFTGKGTSRQLGLVQENDEIVMVNERFTSEIGFNQTMMYLMNVPKPAVLRFHRKPRVSDVQPSDILAPVPVFAPVSAPEAQPEPPQQMTPPRAPSVIKSAAPVEPVSPVASIEDVKQVETDPTEDDEVPNIVPMRRQSTSDQYRASTDSIASLRPRLSSRDFNQGPDGDAMDLSFDAMMGPYPPTARPSDDVNHMHFALDRSFIRNQLRRTSSGDRFRMSSSSTSSISSLPARVSTSDHEYEHGPMDLAFDLHMEQIDEGTGNERGSSFSQNSDGRSSASKDAPPSRRPDSLPLSTSDLATPSRNQFEDAPYSPVFVEASSPPRQKSLVRKDTPIPINNQIEDTSELVADSSSPVFVEAKSPPRQKFIDTAELEAPRRQSAAPTSPPKKVVDTAELVAPRRQSAAPTSPPKKIFDTAELVAPSRRQSAAPSSQPPKKYIDTAELEAPRRQSAAPALGQRKVIDTAELVAEATVSRPAPKKQYEDTAELMADPVPKKQPAAVTPPRRASAPVKKYEDTADLVAAPSKPRPQPVYEDTAELTADPVRAKPAPAKRVYEDTADLVAQAPVKAAPAPVKKPAPLEATKAASSGSSQDAFQIDETAFYHLQWTDGPFGSTVREAESSKGTVMLITKKTGKQTCAGLRRIVVGDLLVRIGDKNVWDLGFEKGTRYLRKVPKPVVLTFQAIE